MYLKFYFLGTFLFESGWEYGYWMSALVHYEASWNPRTEFSDAQSALQNILSVFDSHFGVGWANAIATAGEMMRWPLINGVQNSNFPAQKSTKELNGIAYMQGWDTWSELAQAFNFALTQPQKRQFYDIQLFPNSKPGVSEIMQVINATLISFENVLNLWAQTLKMTQNFPISGEDSIRRDELIDVANITLQRGIQVYNLMLVAIDAKNRYDLPWKLADDALQNALILIRKREQYFNVARIASWRKNPTVYEFTYLWSAHSGFYFWRDRQQLQNASMNWWTPCLMNIQDPVLEFAGQMLEDVMKALRFLVDKFGSDLIGECFASPFSEPVYPKDAHK